MPDRPVLRFLAPSTTHASPTCPLEFVDEHRAGFDKGSDAHPPQTLARQQPLGMIPPKQS